MQRFTISKRRKGGNQIMGYGGFSLLNTLLCVFFDYSENWGGGKCPEEEHTTCSGGPTINCHKRGLWGERILLFYNNKIIIFVKKCENIKIILS
jgi:hypothetical protein